LGVGASEAGQKVGDRRQGTGEGRRRDGTQSVPSTKAEEEACKELETADGTRSVPTTLAEDLEEVVVAVGPEGNCAFFLEIGGHFDEELGGLGQELAVGREEGVISAFDE